MFFSVKVVQIGANNIKFVLLTLFSILKRYNICFLLNTKIKLAFTVDNLHVVHFLLFEELEGIKLGEPCQLFKSNERNKKLCTKVDYFFLDTSFRGLLRTSSGAMK